MWPPCHQLLEVNHGWPKPKITLCPRKQRRRRFLFYFLLLICLLYFVWVHISFTVWQLWSFVFDGARLVLMCTKWRHCLQPLTRKVQADAHFIRTHLSFLSFCFNGYWSGVEGLLQKVSKVISSSEIFVYGQMISTLHTIAFNSSILCNCMAWIINNDRKTVM